MYVYAFTYCIRYLYVHTSLCVVAMFMRPNDAVHDHIVNHCAIEKLTSSYVRSCL